MSHVLGADWKEFMTVISTYRGGSGAVVNRTQSNGRNTGVFRAHLIYDGRPWIELAAYQETQTPAQWVVGPIVRRTEGLELLHCRRQAGSIGSTSRSGLSGQEQLGYRWQDERVCRQAGRITGRATGTQIAYVVTGSKSLFPRDP